MLLFNKSDDFDRTLGADEGALVSRRKQSRARQFSHCVFPSSSFFSNHFCLIHNVIGRPACPCSAQNIFPHSFYFFFPLSKSLVCLALQVPLSLLGHRPFLYYVSSLCSLPLPNMLSPPLLFLFPLPHYSCTSTTHSF